MVANVLDFVVAVFTITVSYPHIDIIMCWCRRACVRACVHACVHACMRACVRACMHVKNGVPNILGN